MKVKGNDGETACNAPSSCWHTMRRSGCAGHDGCCQSRLFHTQVSISVVKMQPGDSSLTELFPCATLHPVSKGPMQRPNFFLMSLMYFFWLMNPQTSTVLHHSKVSCVQGSVPQCHRSFHPARAQIIDNLWYSHQISLCWNPCTSGCHRS